MKRRLLLSKVPLAVIALATLNNSTLTNYLQGRHSSELEKHVANCNCRACLQVSNHQGEQA